MSLKRVEYTKEDGKKTIVLLPEGVSEDEASRGVLLGPPSFSSLELPEEIENRLHNELFIRGIIEPKDALRGRDKIMSALFAAFRVDVDRILTIYVGEDYRNARKESSEDKPNKAVPNRRPRQPVKQT